MECIYVRRLHGGWFCTSCIFLPAGVHLEGPFISKEKKGAHPEQYLRTFESGGIDDLMEAYGSLGGVAMVTLAPELANSQSVVRELCQRGIKVSLGERLFLSQTAAVYFQMIFI